MKYYINSRLNNFDIQGDIETIEETNTLKDANYLLQKYNMREAYFKIGFKFWISKKATKEYYQQLKKDHERN